MPTPCLRAIAALAMLLVAACDAAPLHWEPAAPVVDEPAPPPPTPPLPAAAMPGDARGVRCDSSLRVVMLPDARAVAVWWAVRADSTAVLLSSRGTLALPPRDQRTPPAVATATWERALVIDTLDRGAHGCARPSPAIAFEARTGYVHVSYPLDAPEGTGIFFAHSMDAGQMYHSPVSIIYGPRLAQTAIAARGDTVAIAYEDPNAAESQVALALSVTAGHIFEEKSIALTAGAYPATSPAVAMDADGVIVEWRERQPGRAVWMRRRGAWTR